MEEGGTAETARPAQAAGSAGAAGTATAAGTAQTARTATPSFPEQAGRPAAVAGAPALHPLDNPALASLTGPHAHFAEGRGRIVRYPVDVSPFLALPDDVTAADWADLAALAGPGAEVPLLATTVRIPDGWERTFDVPGVQLVDDGVTTAPEPEAVRLGPDDVPEMLDLVGRTEPGPFAPRTVELGTYLGIRRGGALVAMAGERLRPPGWTEISAVCTDPAHRGQGLGTRLVLAVAHGIKARGDQPFLHTSAQNTNAIRLYESLGFRFRRTTSFRGALVPGRAPVPGQAAPGGK
ncbi:GNAT family N-acetyltransferase [Streptomyces sp. SID335]|uniref:GNAT family N-acetyltransferase n=1 Tax=Streptomyces venezuelae TaxID=54571 RepID=A0A5P2BN70_STRVZ|nr:GNAT family N-acetyltransferase [Streptomyces sp. SID335]NEB43625.1 GNAT family N-acetyltransferase [Streptomyces sp. SID339]QES31926.1 GNAT family N-acetyltransferase [Streptomyces venezuelae]